MTWQILFLSVVEQERITEQLSAWDEHALRPSIQLKIRLLSRPNISSISYNLVAFVSPLLTCLGCIYLNIFQKIGHTIRHRDLYVIICFAGKPFVDPLRFIVSERISHGIRKGLLMKYVFTLQCVSGKGQRCSVGI